MSQLKALEFSLPDHNGVMHSLSDFKGKWVIVYFYPKDDTTGCTKEACSFRDNLPSFADKDVIVIGISADSPDSHKKFIQKYNLNFLLLSDETKEIIKKYDAWGKKTIYGKEYIGILRVTYLINPEGKIVKIYRKVNPDNNAHTHEIMEDLSFYQK